MFHTPSYSHITFRLQLSIWIFVWVVDSSVVQSAVSSVHICTTLQCTHKCLYQCLIWRLYTVRVWEHMILVLRTFPLFFLINLCWSSTQTFNSHEHALFTLFIMRHSPCVAIRFVLLFFCFLLFAFAFILQGGFCLMLLYYLFTVKLSFCWYRIRLFFMLLSMYWKCNVVEYGNNKIRKQ